MLGACLVVAIKALNESMEGWTEPATENDLSEPGIGIEKKKKYWKNIEDHHHNYCQNTKWEMLRSKVLYFSCAVEVALVDVVFVQVYGINRIEHSNDAFRITYTIYRFQHAHASCMHMTIVCTCLLYAHTSCMHMTLVCRCLLYAHDSCMHMPLVCT